MVELHRIGGDALVLNADLIELIEETPETVITLIGGRRVVVQESAQAIIGAVQDFRAGVLADADAMRSRPGDLLVFQVDGTRTTEPIP